MNIISKTIGCILSLTIITLTESCEKFVQLPPPATQLVGSEVFSSDATAAAVLSNIYLSCASGNFASGTLNSVTMLAGLSADEFDLYSDGLELNQIGKNSILSNNGTVYGIWTGAYASIYKCNVLIEGLAKSRQISPAVKDQLTGEAYFMRAFTHFYLAGLFGDVPYVTGTDYRVNTLIKQTSYRQVLQQIIEDLKTAKSLLTAEYTAAGFERVRPNKWAASALLARTSLYAGEWVNAELEASLVINQSALYSLTGLNDVFIKNSKEAIWQIKPVSTTVNTNEGALFILVGKPTGLSMNPDFASQFESADLRRQQWLGSFTNSAGTWIFPYKYKIRNGASPLNEYSMVLRLAEQYLIRAEARTQQDALPGAIADLDVIRQRAGLSKIAYTKPDIAKNNLLLSIEQERLKEFFSEWGHRWLDLKRTNRVDAVLSAKKSNWRPSAAWFPIPSEELKVNYNLIQNEGYQ